jgi:hypothetical protein
LGAANRSAVFVAGGLAAFVFVSGLTYFGQQDTFVAYVDLRTP